MTSAKSRVAELARDASIALNNAAIPLDEPLWLEVRSVCEALEALADGMNV